MTWGRSPGLPSIRILPCRLPACRHRALFKEIVRTMQNNSISRGRAVGDAEADVEDLFPWYKSTDGPGLSLTLSSDALMFLPVANLALSNVGLNILPAQVNLWVSLAVFVFFAARAAYGYIRAKQTLGAQLLSANRQLSALKADMAAAGSK